MTAHSALRGAIVLMGLSAAAPMVVEAMASKPPVKPKPPAAAPASLDSALPLPPYPEKRGDAVLFASRSVLTVDILFHGKGQWSRSNGTFDRSVFRRRLAFKVPMAREAGMAPLFGKSGGYERNDSATPPGVVPGSPMANILAEAQTRCAGDGACISAALMQAAQSGKLSPEAAEQSTQPVDFERFVNLTPVQPGIDSTIGSVQGCGRAVAVVADHSEGKSIGDPGQPPLVPYISDYAYSGLFPGAQYRSVNDFCDVQVSIDPQSKRLHLRLGAGAIHGVVPVVQSLNGRKSDHSMALDGHDAPEQLGRQYTFYDLPIAGDWKELRGSREIGPVGYETNENKEGDFPIYATVRWHVAVR